MHAFLAAFGLIFLMEMGDKSQLVVMALATRYKWQQVLLGVVFASLLTHGLAVLVGGLFSHVIPIGALRIVAGVLFFGFAIIILRGSREEAEAEGPGPRCLRRWPALTVACTFFVSEFGDKTQLATVAAAASSGQPLATWLGAACGMVVADCLGIVAGRFLKRVPLWMVRFASASVFLVFGWLSIAEGWGVSGVLPLVVAFLLPLLVFPFAWRRRLEGQGGTF